MIEQKKTQNNTYEIELGSPLLRPGLVIRTKVSRRYATTAAQALLEIAREINSD